VVGLVAACSLLAVVQGIHGMADGSGNWVYYYEIAAGVINLAAFGGVLFVRIRQAARPMEGVRDAVLTRGVAWFPSWLLARLLRAVGADSGDLPGPTGAPRPPAPAPAPAPVPPAVSAEQAIGRARDTVGRFPRPRPRLRPGYLGATTRRWWMPHWTTTQAPWPGSRFPLTRRPGLTRRPARVLTPATRSADRVWLGRGGWRWPGRPRRRKRPRASRP
jgi:hypothetical protein